MVISKGVLLDFVICLLVFLSGIYGLISNDFFNLEATTRPLYPTFGSVVMVVYGCIGFVRLFKKTRWQ